MANTELKERYLKAKRRLFDKVFCDLNSEQRQAVYTVKGPLLVLAGAGSGKTTVLVRRIQYILQYGNGYMSDRIPDGLDEDAVSDLEAAGEFLTKTEIEPMLSRFSLDRCPPYAILAITFTNKAAREIKERLARYLGETVAEEIWSGTFHSVCLRILRRDADRLGYRSGLTVYDTDDTKKVISNIMKELNIDEKLLPIKDVQNIISRAKDCLQTPEAFAEDIGSNIKYKETARIYKVYRTKLKEANAVDFDDIIMQTVLLLRENPDILSYYQKKFKYVCIDEYQDTNPAQFELARLLSGGSDNLMVVGDDDQSIYRFRGATVENILRFDKIYTDAKVIKLEQNYRSTKNILEAANGVIAHNEERHGKSLWTDKGEGEKIKLVRLDDQQAEARYITESILEQTGKGDRKFSDFAVLFRVNAQANALESVFAKSGIPYRVLGGMRFFDRKEIKDIISYLCVILNPNDTLRLMRIINEPKRKIGAATLGAVTAIANELGVSPFSVMEKAEEHTALKSSCERLKAFTRFIREMQEYAKTHEVSELINTVADRSGYRAMLREAGEAEKDRLENLDELVSTAIEYEKREDEPTLVGFLEEVALVSDVDKYDENADAVVLMTVHSAKGLEFPCVYIAGMEEGVFPSTRSISEPAEIPEERRLAYVAITRAKERLVITSTKQRLIYGMTSYNPISRFVTEIPKEYTESENKTDRGTVASGRISPYRETRRTSTIPTYYGMGGKREPAKTRIFAAGDRVRSTGFGLGTVISAIPAGGDVIYEVEFDTVGRKKLMGTFAKLLPAE